MDDIKSVLNLITRDCFMASIDLKVAYYSASFLDQGLFLEMWGGWMLSSDVAGVLQEAGDAYSRART